MQPRRRGRVAGDAIGDAAGTPAPGAAWRAGLTVLGAVALLGAGRAEAQGFGLNEIGSCAIARGFAVTGAPCEDASVLYWNPGAAATLPRGLSVYGGVSAIQVGGSFTQDYTRRRYAGDVPVEFPPFLGATWKGKGRLALGLAAYVPYGLTSQWGDDFVGRFSAQRASLQSIYVQPNLAVEVIPGRLSVGGGPVIGRSSLELRQALDIAGQQVPGQPAGITFARLGFAPGTEFASARVQGTATGVGYNLGAHARLTDRLTLGVRYLSQVRFDYDGAEAEFTPSPSAQQYVLRAGNPILATPLAAALQLRPGSTLADLTRPNFGAGQALAPGQTASTRIDHPAQFQAGLGWTTTANTLSADYALIRWTSFQQLPVDFGATSPLTRTLREDFANSHSFRVGGEHRYRGGVAARAGFSYATSPAPDETVTPLLPDMDRYNLALGAGIPLGGRYVLDAGYLRVETEGRRGRSGERPASFIAAQTVEQLNDGWYALNANIFTVSLKARF